MVKVVNFMFFYHNFKKEDDPILIVCYYCDAIKEIVLVMNGRDIYIHTHIIMQ